MSITPDVQVQNLQISEIVILHRIQKKKNIYTHMQLETITCKEKKQVL